MNGKHVRLKRIEKETTRATELSIGGGRSIVVTPEDRYEMFRSALGDGDHPLLCSIRSSEDVSTADPFARFLMALDSDPRTLPEDMKDADLSGPTEDLSE
jgi:hypothetical protein